MTRPASLPMPGAETRLLADIGGRYARFALSRGAGRLEDLVALPCAEFPHLLDAVQAYLARLAGPVRHAAFAIANPVEGDLVRMTNYHWQFSIEETRQALGLETLLVVNDFTALAMGLPYLGADERIQVGGGRSRERSVIGLLGPGSGLGVSGLIPLDDGGWISLGSEGGHVTCAARDERERVVLDYAARSFEHVSCERVVSASGLELIFRALAQWRGQERQGLEAARIVRQALDGACTLSLEAVEVFCGLLGTAAADLAVTLGARGGVFIGGWVVPQLGELFTHSGFRARFESKGRLSSYVGQIPTYVVASTTATLLGTGMILDAQLRRRAGTVSLLDRVRQARPELTVAERRVADLVLERPRNLLNDPIVDIALRAGVSQPTVVRFCRSLGCEGLSDFKLKLASGLTGTIPLSHTQVQRSDTITVLGAKVFDNTAAALLHARDRLSSGNGEALEAALGHILAAPRLEFHALGNYAIVAEDALYKFLRLGIPTAAYTEPRLQAMAAAALGPKDVAVLVSGSGRMGGLFQVVEAGLAAGATVIAICPGHSPLARKASLAIAVDHGEDVTTQIPMISRILHLMAIDILAVGVAMRRAGPAFVAPDAAPAREPVRTSAADLSRLTAHGR